MKEFYEEPTIEIIDLCNEDIITSSTCPTEGESGCPTDF